MQNFDEPVCFSTCRREGDKIASVLFWAAGHKKVSR